MDTIKGFKNSWIVTEKGLEKTSLVYDELFTEIGTEHEELEQLPEDYVVVPGFIDQHIHGAAGSDAMDGTVEDLSKIANALAKEGTTAFLATTMTQSPENITNANIIIKTDILIFFHIRTSFRQNSTIFI